MNDARFVLCLRLARSVLLLLILFGGEWFPAKIGLLQEKNTVNLFAMGLF